MESLNELNINSIYDYFAYCREHEEKYKLVILITNKQVVYCIKNRSSDDHWNMIVDVNKIIFPERHYDENTILNNTVIITSAGVDLEIEIPDVVSEFQYKSIQDVLRQARQFEYDYDSFLYMPYDSYEIINMCDARLSNKIIDGDDEIILDESNKKKKQ